MYNLKKYQNFTKGNKVNHFYLFNKGARLHVMKT